MPKLQQLQIPKYIFLLLLSVVLTGFTLVLGAIPMRVIRKAYSRKAYWIGMAVVVAFCFFYMNGAIAIALGLLTSLVGLYTDAEEAGSGPFASGFFASLTTSAFALVAASFWASKKKLDLIQVAQSNIEQVLTQVKSINPQVNLTVESLVYQVPSFFVISLLASLAAALLWDRLLGRAMGMGIWQSTSRSLLNFRVPDVLVWFAIFAVAGAFGQEKYVVLKNICVNLVNVLAFVYFFQGLAVTKHLFTVNRVSRLWQSIGFLLLFLQLFPLASILGFSDYWVDYRIRFTKKRPDETPYKSEN